MGRGSGEGLGFSLDGDEVTDGWDGSHESLQLSIVDLVCAVCVGK